MRRLHIILMLLLSTIFLASCGDDAPPEPGADAIHGRWQCVSMRPDSGGEWSAWPYEPSFLTFSATGQMQSEGYYGFASGSWHETGGAITCSLNDGSQLRMRILESGDDSLEARITTVFGSAVVRLHKVPL